MAEAITLANLRKDKKEPIPEKKKCRECKIEKDTKKDFSTKPTNKDGRHTICKACDNKTGRSRAASKKDWNIEFI